MPEHEGEAAASMHAFIDVGLVDVLAMEVIDPVLGPGRK